MLVRYWFWSSNKKILVLASLKNNDHFLVSFLIALAYFLLYDSFLLVSSFAVSYIVFLFVIYDLIVLLIRNGGKNVFIKFLWRLKKHKLQRIFIFDWENGKTQQQYLEKYVLRMLQEIMTPAKYIYINETSWKALKIKWKDDQNMKIVCKKVKILIACTWFNAYFSHKYKTLNILQLILVYKFSLWKI